MHLYLIHKHTVREQSKIPSTTITADHAGSTRSSFLGHTSEHVAKNGQKAHSAACLCAQLLPHSLAECLATRLVRKELPSLAGQARAHACHMLTCSSAVARAMWGSMSVTSEAMLKTQCPNTDDSHAMSPQADLASSVEKAISPDSGLLRQYL